MSKPRLFEFSDMKVAVDKYGNEHKVIVYGMVEQTSEKKLHIDDVKLSNGIPGAFIEGNLVYRRRAFKRRLAIGYAICHPEDEFNALVGEKIAKRRCKKNPYAEAETNSVTMFHVEDLEAIVTSKLSHICKNIDKFIE